MRARRAPSFVVVALALWAHAAAAQRPRAGEYPLKHARGWDPVVGAHLGPPTMLSATVGVGVGLGRRLPGSVFAAFEPGSGGLATSLGWLASRGQEGLDGGAGLSVRATYLRPNGNALGVGRGRFLGVQAQRLMGLYVSYRGGLYRDVDRSGRWAASADIGFGY